MSDLRGFNYSNVSLRKIQKDKYILSKELELQISRTELKKKMVAVLDNNGKVYFICKKKEVCGVVVVRYEKHFASEFEFEGKSSETKDMGTVMIEGAIHVEDVLQDKLGTEKSKKKYAEQKQTANAYVLEGLYLTEELKAKDKIIMFDIIDELKEVAAMNDLCVKVIIWGDTIVADKTIGKIGGNESSAISIGVCLGMCFGAMFGTISGNLSLGICIGISIGCAIGAGFYGSAKLKKMDIVNKEKTSENERIDESEDE